MYKSLAFGAGAIAILAAIALVPGRVEAGASASAPSKYAAQTRHGMAVNQHARRNFGITEYSSSSAKKTTSPKR
jgi:hypothetical protein